MFQIIAFIVAQLFVDRAVLRSGLPHNPDLSSVVVLIEPQGEHGGVVSLQLPNQSGTPGGPCFCGHPNGYARCCGPVVEQRSQALTAEGLMRSRYSAFCVDDRNYLLHSWHPETRPNRIGSSPTVTWLGLSVINSDAGGETDDHGTVEFIARFSDPAGEHNLHELSTFVRLDGRWVYLDGEDKSASGLKRG